MECHQFANWFETRLQLSQQGTDVILHTLATSGQLPSAVWGEVQALHCLRCKDVEGSTWPSLCLLSHRTINPRLELIGFICLISLCRDKSGFWRSLCPSGVELCHSRHMPSCWLASQLIENGVSATKHCLWYEAPFLIGWCYWAWWDWLHWLISLY